MDPLRVAAEVMPTEQTHAGRVASGLARLGLRVLHVGTTVSVDGTRDQWEAALGVSFTPETKTVQAEIGRQAEFLRADPTSVRLPEELDGLIADVAFTEPPELH